MVVEIKRFSVFDGIRKWWGTCNIFKRTLLAQ